MADHVHHIRSEIKIFSRWYADNPDKYNDPSNVGIYLVGLRGTTDRYLTTFLLRQSPTEIGYHVFSRFFKHSPFNGSLVYKTIIVVLSLHTKPALWNRAWHTILVRIKSSSPNHIRGEASTGLVNWITNIRPLHGVIRYGVLVAQEIPVDKISDNTDIINDPLTRNDEKSCIVPFLFGKVHVVLDTSCQFCQLFYE